MPCAEDQAAGQRGKAQGHKRQVSPDGKADGRPGGEDHEGEEGEEMGERHHGRHPFPIKMAL